MLDAKHIQIIKKLISESDFSFIVFQPDTVTGDIVFVLQLKEHAKFKRKGDDLFVEHSLNLTEALCGYRFVLQHLDGRQLLIKSEIGEIVKPGMLISIFWNFGQVVQVITLVLISFYFIIDMNHD